MQIDNPLNNKQALYLIWATILNQSQSANSTLDKTLEMFQRLSLNENFLESLVPAFAPMSMLPVVRWISSLS